MNTTLSHENINWSLQIICHISGCQPMAPAKHSTFQLITAVILIILGLRFILPMIVSMFYYQYLINLIYILLKFMFHFLCH